MPLAAQFNRLEAFQVTVPAGTAKAAPHQTDVSFDPGNVVGVDITVPDGHAGFTGIALAEAHQPVVPYSAGQWLVANNHTFEFPIVGLIDTGDFQTFTYNTDVFDHSFYVRFYIVDGISAQAGQTASLLPLDLSAIGG